MKIIKLLSFLIFSFSTCTQAQSQEKNSFLNPERILLPWNRMIQPAGLQVWFGDKALENHALDAALSPDGKYLAVMERYSIVFIKTSNNKVVYTLPVNSHKDLIGGMNAFSGITWHSTKNSDEIFWSVIGVRKRSFIAVATWDGSKAEFSRLIEYKAAPGADMALPNEFIIREEYGHKYLYCLLNGNNNLVKQKLSSGDTVWIANPGVAPYGMTIAAGKIYVSNWAGRFPEQGDKEVAGVPWGSARVNNDKGGSTREGSVSVIEPGSGKVIKEIITGLHPNDIVASADGRFVYVANANSDNISVINTAKDEIAETINVRLQPSLNSFFGDSPDGLCLSPDGKTLYVANGMDNAVAVISLGRLSSKKGNTRSSSVSGFIPTGAYPSSICLSEKGILYICNLESEGVRLGLPDRKSPNLVYNSHHQLASVSVIPEPSGKELKAFTDTVIAVNDMARAAISLQKPRPEVSPKAVPERIGEPSLFRHVLYIIRENRTYDQVLGDMKEGNGDPDLCIYGENITPNAHKLSREFMLLDNFHVSGKSSPEGHQWTDASIVTDYIEKNIRAWFRSYPHVQNDALVYAPSGFLWDNGLKHGKSVRIYGEASIPVFSTKMTWSEIYHKYLSGEKIDFYNKTTIDPVRNILCPSYPSYGNHEFTDAMRADAFIKELNDFKALPGDQLPELMIMALPNDHTNGIKPGYPTPRAMVADNDQALGRIVEAVSESRFWENTVIFVVEDDSQGGWDHVSAYRTVSLVISPYSRLKSVNHTFYTQPSLVRTIEQILGLNPMNIQDAIANPMTDCFSSVIDKMPYSALPANIRLDEMNPDLVTLKGRELHYAKMSMLPEFEGIDSGSDDLLNRILWFAEKGNLPYPSKYAGAARDERDENDND